MWDAADLSALIDPDLPGYALGTKADLSQIGGLFRAPYAESFGLVSGNDPVFTCLLATAPANGAGITITSIAYTVTGHKPDQRGMVVIDLEKQ